MVFDISDLDKVVLLQALYAHAEAAGYGKLEYKIKDRRGIRVNGLSLEEAKAIWEKSAAQIASSGSAEVVDYHNGKPIKLDVKRNPSTQRLLAYSSSFDTRNGRYRFLEALLSSFGNEEIIIKEKGYSGHFNDAEKGGHVPDVRPQSETKLLRQLLRSALKVSDIKGTYWKLNPSVKYEPPFMRA